MRDADIDLARLQARKDAVLARFQARAYLWQGLQGAALAVMGLSVAGFLQAALTADQAGWPGTTGFVALVGSALLLAHQEDQLDLEVIRVDEAMERLKSRGSP